MQWNAEAMSSKKVELTSFVQENKIDVFAIQETKMISRDKTPTIPGYTIIRKDRQQRTGQETNRGGGLLMGIKDTIPFRESNIEIREDKNDTITEWQTIEIPVRGKEKI